MGGSMKKRIGPFLENLVIVAIVLVLAQTFLEDLATLTGWSWSVRRALLFAGFAFDLFFTIEFLVRSFNAAANGRFLRYFSHERGWIDFLASIPLLVLNSGPQALALMAGGVSVAGIGGIMNVLKVVKAIRIARVLRLLRVIKVFRRIKNTDSVMAQRHMAKITGIAVTAVVGTLLGFTLLSTVITIPSLEEKVRDQNFRTIDYITQTDLADPSSADRLEAYAASESDILVVMEEGRVRYSRYEQGFYDTYFGPIDYAHIAQGSTRVFYDVRDLNQAQARENIIYFAIILVMVAVFLLYYSPHFALTVTDPIHIMRRGFEEKGYNLEVKTPDLYAGDDVYRLARQYNEVYLPLKDRSDAGEESTVLDLKIDDIKDVFDDAP